MGRIEIKPIRDNRKRRTTLRKRKRSVFNKSYELSVLCGADIAVIIFGPNKKLYVFSSGDIDETLTRYSICSPHERKGLADFQGNCGGNEDESQDEDEEIGILREDLIPPEHWMTPSFQLLASLEGAAGCDC